MFICKICGLSYLKYSNLRIHVSAKKDHPTLVEYLAKFDKNCSKESLIKMYIEDQISVKKIASNLGFGKAILFKLMRHFDIKIRTISESTKIQIKRDGLWNKGLNKFEHPSIMRYAKSREGENNPYYTAPNFEERQQKNRERMIEAIKNGRGLGKHIPKSTEQRMRKILESNNIQYLPHFCIKRSRFKWYIYDFLINGKLILEMQGDYYHANPKYYEAEDTIVVAHKREKASEIWERDKKKKTKAKKSGYRYKAIWEDLLNKISDKEAFELINKDI